MKILLVHHRIPYPLTSGADKVCYNLMRTLATQHEVTFLVSRDESTSEEQVDIVRRTGAQMILVPVKNRIKRIGRSRIQSFQRWFQLVVNRVPTYVYNEYYPELDEKVAECCLSGKYDIAQAMSDMTSLYLERDYPNVYRILGPIDDMVETARTNLRATTTLRKRVMLLLEYRARRHYQPSNCKKYDGVFFYSGGDQQRTMRRAGDMPHTAILPIAVEANAPRYEVSVQAEPEPNSVIFVGGLGSLFNQDAVHFFYSDILPLIRQKVPAVKFYIVGQYPPASILKMAQADKVIVTGAVEEVRPYIQKACVCVAPIRAGTGFKTKIVEALSLGKSIVSTSMGVSGLWELNRPAISVVDQPESFANEVIRLLKDPVARKDMEKNAFELFQKAYSFDAVKPKTLKVYEEMITHITGRA
jgi:glycosyltransferase involved in cell wall biosynthesis